MTFRSNITLGLVGLVTAATVLLQMQNQAPHIIVLQYAQCQYKVLSQDFKTHNIINVAAKSTSIFKNFVLTSVSLAQNLS